MGHQISKTEQTITLKDGRKLGFAEWGDADGKPVFHFNGACGSRMERPADESVLAGVHYISTDRPGHGLSDFQPGRKLLDWPDDVTQLADYLGIDKFYALGYSRAGHMSWPAPINYRIACWRARWSLVWRR